MDLYSDLAALKQHLFRLSALHTPHFSSDMYLLAGVEEQQAGSPYFWDGLKRSAEHAFPFIVFQVTLSGWGCYAEGKRIWQVQPKMAFTAIVPSDHRYYFPSESQTWSFFWLILRHPYVVERLMKSSPQQPVMTLALDSLLFSRAVRLFEGALMPGHFQDRYAEEEAMFGFMLEYDRVINQMRDAQTNRTQMLRQVRTSVLHSLHRPLSVDEIAAQFGMRRSHFSHDFKAITGLTPAAYMIQIRLEEAVQRLLYSLDSLHNIASSTGFLDASHFCKVFRRHYHISPGEFRRQARWNNRGHHEDPDIRR